jgi:fatty acid-binding protein DegV
MARVAVVTDSASDLTEAVAAERGIRVVPLYVSFGEAEFRAGVDLSTDEFWARMLAPDAPSRRLRPPLQVTSRRPSRRSSLPGPRPSSA